MAVTSKSKEEGRSLDRETCMHSGQDLRATACRHGQWWRQDFLMRGHGVPRCLDALWVYAVDCDACAAGRPRFRACGVQNGVIGAESLEKAWYWELM
jgi:hypothetical protein